MNKIHKIELVVIELNDVYGIDTILEQFNRSINTISMTGITHKISSESKDFIWDDNNPLNKRDITSKEVLTYFDNLDNDEYQQYLKLKEKFEE